MFISLLSLLACSVSYPNSSNPNNYQLCDNTLNYGMYADLYITDVDVGNGYDSVFLSYVDSDTGVRNTFLGISILLDNNNQETTIYVTSFDTFNYYGYFAIAELGAGYDTYLYRYDVNFYKSDSLEYSFTIPYSQQDPSSWIDYHYRLQLNYLNAEQYGTLSDSPNVYQEGYNDGYTNGVTVGEGTGYQNGLTTGERTGYQNGYRDGLAAATSDYGFLSLFGSIADTPVMMIRNLFNFDLFGTSMLVVVLSLFTALVLMKILKKIVK